MRRCHLIYSLCLLAFLMFCGISLFPRKDPPRSEPLVVPPEDPAPQASNTSPDATPDTFYQFIIDNNLFRPLGWQPPKQQPDYILLGTVVAQFPQATTAVILERRSKQLQIITVGDTLGTLIVTAIEPKQVTLCRPNGQQILMRGAAFQSY